VGLSRSELSKQALALYEEITARGESEASVAELFGWDPETYEQVRNRMLEMKAELFRNRPREHVFVEYVIQQQRNIRDLDEVIKKLDKTKMHAATIGAIRLRSEIQSGVIEKGQEFGLIKKEAERKEIVAGLFLGDMTRGQLSDAIVKELAGFKELMDRFEDVPMAALVTGGNLHYGPKAPAMLDAEGEEVADDEPKPVKKASRK
jgi:hypothetical protein